MADSIRLVLPIPPSTNNLYVARRDGRGRAKTSAYAAWQQQAGWEAALQLRDQPVPAPMKHVAVSVEAPVSYARDLDNLLKPIADLLVKLTVLVDDRWIDEWHVKRVTAAERLVVVVRQLLAEAEMGLSKAEKEAGYKMRPLPSDHVTAILRRVAGGSISVTLGEDGNGNPRTWFCYDDGRVVRDHRGRDLSRQAFNKMVREGWLIPIENGSFLKDGPPQQYRARKPSDPFLPRIIKP